MAEEFLTLMADLDDESQQIMSGWYGKRRPEYVRSYIELLRKISETDSNRVVRIHSLGAVKAAGSE